MQPRNLRATERWFQESVVAPLEAGGRRLAPAASAVLPSKTLSPAQRVGIYADAYLARLVEALEGDFPALSRLLGPAAFRRLCRGYLARHPSRSRSLNPLGRKLPAFLSGPAKAKELAKLEVAMSEVFDAGAVEPLRPRDFGRLSPERLAGARLSFVPAFRLLDLDHDLNPYVDAVRQERKELPPLKRKRSWIAVYRKEFRVRRLDLTEAAHAALSALQRGRTVSQAVAAAARVWEGTPAGLQSLIRRCFGEWAGEGFFASISWGSRSRGIRPSRSARSPDVRRSRAGSPRRRPPGSGAARRSGA